MWQDLHEEGHGVLKDTHNCSPFYAFLSHTQVLGTPTHNSLVHLLCCVAAIAAPPPGHHAQVHNISDIIGGFILAIIFTTPYSIRAIGLHTCFREHIDGLQMLQPPGAGNGRKLAPDGPSQEGDDDDGYATGPTLPVSTHHSTLGVGGALGAGQFGTTPGRSPDVVLNMGAAAPASPARH